MTPIEIQQAIVQENLTAIKAVKGIGLKTAQACLMTKRQNSNDCRIGRNSCGKKQYNQRRNVISIRSSG